MKFSLQQIENKIPFSSEVPETKQPRSKGGKPLTYNQYRTSLILEQMFKELKEKTKKENGRSMTQLEAASKLGIEQSSFSGYLIGRIPLGQLHELAFCNLFGCKLWEIRPETLDQELVEDNKTMLKLLKSMVKGYESSVSTGVSQKLLDDARSFIEKKAA